MATPDREPFETLYRRHRGAVYRFLLRDLRNREDAEDATQTAFLQAYAAYERGSRPERPHAWLVTIADNLRRRRFRTLARRPEEVPLDEAVLESPPRDERVEDLHAALDTLPFNQRAALVLREVVGLSYAEIAHHLSISVGAVQMLLFRARRTLREELAAAGRRVGALLPPWVVNLMPSADRFNGSLRTGAAVAAAATAAVAVTGAQSSAVERRPARPAAPTAETTAQPQPTAPSTRRAPARVSAATPGSSRTTPVTAQDAVSPPFAAPAPASTQAEPAASPPPPALLAVPGLPVPVPAPAVPPVAPPALPLPPLPVVEVPKEVEGALDPQLDAVLAGR